MSRRPTIPRRVALLVPMLGATIGAEALAARDALVRTLAVAGLDLNDLAAAIPIAEEPTPIGVRATSVPAFFDMARACRDLDCGRLTVPEKRFVGDMIRLGRAAPTPRQTSWLSAIFGKLVRRAA